MTTTGNSGKAVYVQPKLAIYGGFSQLTASGSVGNNETSGNANNGADRKA